MAFKFYPIAVLMSFVGLKALAEVSTVSSVDLERYLGKWYEVASIPQSFQSQCVGNTTAEYSKAEKNKIRVFNSCDTADGKRSVAEGRAKIIDGNSNSKLKVTFVKIMFFTLNSM